MPGAAGMPFHTQGLEDGHLITPSPKISSSFFAACFLMVATRGWETPSSAAISRCVCTRPLPALVPLPDRGPVPACRGRAAPGR